MQHSFYYTSIAIISTTTTTTTTTTITTTTTTTTVHTATVKSQSFPNQLVSHYHYSIYVTLSRPREYMLNVTKW